MKITFEREHLINRIFEAIEENEKLIAMELNDLKNQDREYEHDIKVIKQVFKDHIEKRGFARDALLPERIRYVVGVDRAYFNWGQLMLLKEKAIVAHVAGEIELNDEEVTLLAGGFQKRQQLSDETKRRFEEATKLSTEVSQ